MVDIQSCEKMVRYFALKYGASRKFLLESDQYDTARTALIDAAATFDSAVGVKFSTHAWWCIQNAMQKRRRITRRTVYLRQGIPRSADPLDALILKERVATVAELADRLPPRWKRVLTLRLRGESKSRIAEALGISLWSVRNAWAKTNREFRKSRKLSP